MRICQECGSHGEDGELEWADGTRAHFRKFPPKSEMHGPLPIYCRGRFVEVGEPPKEKAVP